MRVFVSYRRDDAAGHAGRIADQLVARYGRDAVFIDVEAIDTGVDFIKAIEESMATADAVLVVIGPGWLRASGEDGRPRLENPRDFVRLEIESALERGIRTIPVLVQGASMPEPDELPPALAQLARLNATELVDRRFHADLDALFAALEGRPARTAASGGIRVPPQPTKFVGRAPELAAIHELLHRGEVRLLTLTGPGGTGKTRLAVEAVSTLGERYPEGIWFVGLAALRDPGLIVPTIASTLGLREGPDTTVEEMLERHLRDRRILLVIDNVEQLLPDAASVLGDLVAGAPDLEMVVSSREPLMIRAEHVYPVHELSIEDAVKLFAERAQAAVPGFELDEARLPVEAICARLDGLPLAIELTAARIKLVSAVELLERLDVRLPLLVGGARDLPERQRTMRATIAWSYDLLGEDERRLFADLAVFIGGCTLDAAEEVCRADMDIMGSLVDKSLLRTEARPRGTTRYLSLETIREYAQERLTEGPETGELLRRHATYFLELARGAPSGLKGRDQDAWLERLESEHDNLRGALRWALNEGDIALALEMSASLWPFWYQHGDVTEGRAWLTESLQGADTGPTETRALALAGAGWLASEQGDGGAAALLEDALRCAPKSAPALRAQIMMLLGGCITDDPGRARTVLQEAVSLARTTEDRWVLAVSLNNLAESFREEGDNARATAMYEESLLISSEIDDRFHVALSMVNLGEMAHIGGDLAQARELFSDVQELTRQRGDIRHLSIALLDLGWVSMSEGLNLESEQHFGESLSLLWERGDMPFITSALRGLAAVAAARGEDVRAGQLVGAVERLEDQVGSLPTPPDAGASDSHLIAARARAGDLWDDYRNRGREMQLDSALAYAANGSL